MQHVLQKYILCTCHEIAQVGSPIICFHPSMHYKKTLFFKRSNVTKMSTSTKGDGCFDFRPRHEKQKLFFIKRFN